MFPCTSPSLRLIREPCQPSLPLFDQHVLHKGPGCVLSQWVLTGNSKPCRDKQLSTMNSRTLEGLVSIQSSHSLTGGHGYLLC